MINHNTVYPASNNPDFRHIYFPQRYCLFAQHKDRASLADTELIYDVNTLVDAVLIGGIDNG